ncbi:MAG: glycosyltransferase [Acidaminococcaceae bacterium]|nr:glycosyltransferase [Acidaminococcaceae bacterium]
MAATEEKPLISLLMAVYEPRLDWLREQLDSLNAQTYPNLRLYVRDDCSPTVPFEEIQRLVVECITAFPYRIARNERNLGSNGTFEMLTGEAEGEYFAYCDQDDVWLPEKLAVLRKEMEQSGALLACSDMYIIDGDGKRVAGSITSIRKHHVFRSGGGLAPGLLVSNFVTGCTMLVHSELAKAAAPFCPDMVHDHYLALFAATKGKVLSLTDRLISYRIHGNNQTLMMAGVKDKESYCRIRIEALIRRFEWLQRRFSADAALSPEIAQALVWAKARLANFQGDKRARRAIIKYRRFSPLTSLFEVVMAGAPEGMFMWFIQMKKKNIL